VELHNGDIQLNSKLGEGTSFIVSLPLLWYNLKTL
jgi:signal transduction histidine kinase